VHGRGCRTYLAVHGGFDVPEQLGSRSTFALGRFGGHGGRTLRAGDVLHLAYVGKGGTAVTDGGISRPPLATGPQDDAGYHVVGVPPDAQLP